MPDPLEEKILQHLGSNAYRPQPPEKLARLLDVPPTQYNAFRDALRELMHEGRVVSGSRGAVLLPAPSGTRDAFIGTYRHNRRGFGFVVPTDPQSHEDLFIPPGENGAALTGDTVRATITSRGQRDGKALYTGRIVEVLKRGNSRFVGTLQKQGTRWVVLPDGNALTEPVLIPDAGSRRAHPGTKVVVELTQFPEEGQPAQGVIAEVLGRDGEKDVDLKSIIVQHNLPGPFPEEVLDQARQAVQSFDPHAEMETRFNLSDLPICTIDPPDAKDYDDAISLVQNDDGHW
jgi:ribonuclease R